jgi:hypothetical protein
MFQVAEGLSMRRMIGRLMLSSMLGLSALPAVAEETLRMTLPAGFGLSHAAEAGGDRLREYLPEGQTPESWREMISVQRFGAGAGQDPRAYLERVIAELRAVCPAGRATPVNAAQDGPYVTAVAMMGCEASPRTGGTEVFVMRATSGREAMHVLQFAWTRDPSRDEVSAAMEVLSRALLCDTARAEAPCPEGGVLP